MAEKHYNFKIGKPVPLLNEAEWFCIEPLLLNRIRAIKEYRQQHGATIAEAAANEPAGKSALALYAQLTGEELDHPDQLWSVRMSAFGAPCPSCKRPFRTPKARLCAECGFELPAGKLAGPLGGT